MVAALDWGLGHASRCVPVIEQLLAQDARVYLASSGAAYRFFEQEYPDLPLFKLSLHNFKYWSNHMTINMALQWPKIVRAIIRDRYLIRQLMEQHHFDIIISDNRFGCYHPNAYNIFITHQLYLKLPPWPLVNWLFNQQLNHRFIRRFDTCWIPDLAKAQNLSGRLSHPPFGKMSRYIGPLSRLNAVETPLKYEYLFLLSGPEPQRSRLEAKLRQQIPLLTGKILLVQGRAGATETGKKLTNFEVVPFLKGEDISRAIMSSRYIICRSGYSTIMDLVKLQKTALLIPTPGQTEQEYLAQKLSKAGLFSTQTQKDIDLSNAPLLFVESPDFEPFTESGAHLAKAIKDLLVR